MEESTQGIDPLQTADPQISRQKFDKEVTAFTSSSARHRKRGILLLDQTFPNVKLSFFALKINPAPHIFSVCINFTNYDVEPLSVQFIDPFLDAPVLINQMAHQFPRKIGEAVNQVNLQPLVMAQADGIPFFCIPGVREYHNHPAHTGDNWLLHRGLGGEGTLGFLIEKLYQYGVSGLNGLQVTASFNKAVLSFDLKTIPQ